MIVSKLTHVKPQQLLGVHLISSCALMESVYQKTGRVMALMIVLVVLMKTKPSVPPAPSSSSAQMAGVHLRRIFVTDEINAETTVTKIKFVSVSKLKFN